MITHVGGQRRAIDAIFCEHDECDECLVLRGPNYASLFDKAAKAGWTHHGSETMPTTLDHREVWRVFLDLDGEWRCPKHRMDAEAYRQHLNEIADKNDRTERETKRTSNDQSKGRDSNMATTMTNETKAADMQTGKRGSLIVTRRVDESIIIRTPAGEMVEVLLMEVRDGKKARLRISAPISITVDRDEVDEAKRAGPDVQPNRKPKTCRRPAFRLDRQRKQP